MSSDVPMKALERLAISQRLDLQADYLQVTSQVKNLGLTKSFRLVGALDFGVNSERETDYDAASGLGYENVAGSHGAEVFGPYGEGMHAGEHGGYDAGYRAGSGHHHHHEGDDGET